MLYRFFILYILLILGQVFYSPAFSRSNDLGELGAEQASEKANWNKCVSS